MPSVNPFSVIGVRADGSRVSLWHGETQDDAQVAITSMRQTKSYAELYIEKNGQRWTREWTNSSKD